MIFIIHIPIIIDTIGNNFLEVRIRNNEFLIESLNDLMRHCCNDSIYHRGSLGIGKTDRRE